MKQFECPYYDECGLLCDQTNENCRVKELFEDFYKVEKLYIEANVKCEQLEQENEELKKKLMQKDEVNTFFNTLDWNDDPCKICPQKNCLHEIEKICTHETINLTDSCVSGGRYFEILQKIKEVKGNE